MYNNALGTGGLATGSALAATGAGIIWAILAAFAFIALGTAVKRILPVRNRDND